MFLAYCLWFFYVVALLFLAGVCVVRFVFICTFYHVLSLCSLYLLSTCRFLCGVNVVLSFFCVGVCVIGIVLYALFHFLSLCSLFLLITWWFVCGVTVCDIALSVNCWYYIGARGLRFVQLAVGDSWLHRHQPKTARPRHRKTRSSKLKTYAS